MDRIQILQNIINDVAKKKYQGAYLWKYISYEITSAVNADYQNQNRNSVFKNAISDYIPKASSEKIHRTKQLLEGLPEREIFFGLVSLRREYKGKLVHTACDAYIQVLDEDWYWVLENDPGDYEEEISFATKNINLFSPVGVVGLYGEDTVDKEELVKFFLSTMSWCWKKHII